MRWAPIVVATCLLVAMASPATAFRPQFCAAKYTVASIELRGGWKILGIHFADGRKVHWKMTKNEWRSCDCFKDREACECCEFDLVQVCAEAERINTTTNSRLHLDPCKGTKL